MNAIHSLVAVLATVVASGAFAHEATPDTWIHEARSVTTREAVREQARLAVAAGEIGHGEYTHDFAKHFTPRLTRAQVVAEAVEAQRLGLVQGGEFQRVATPAQLESIRRAGSGVVGTSIAGR